MRCVRERALFRALFWQELFRFLPSDSDFAEISSLLMQQSSMTFFSAHTKRRRFASFLHDCPRLPAHRANHQTPKEQTDHEHSSLQVLQYWYVELKIFVIYGGLHQQCCATFVLARINPKLASPRQNPQTAEKNKKNIKQPLSRPSAPALTHKSISESETRAAVGLGVTAKKASGRAVAAGVEFCGGCECDTRVSKLNPQRVGVGGSG